MEKARQAIYTKQLSALISPDDYDFLKGLSESHEISLADVIRNVIKQFKQEFINTEPSIKGSSN